MTKTRKTTKTTFTKFDGISLFLNVGALIGYLIQAFAGE